MTTDYASRISTLIQENEAAIGAQWLTDLEAATMRSSAVSKEQLRKQCAQFLALFIAATRSGSLDNMEHRSWDEVRDLLSEISGIRARQGSTPSETATFIFSLKQPLFTVLRQGFGADAQALADASWMLGTLLDRLGLYTIEVFQKTRDQVIVRQQQELLELSSVPISGKARMPSHSLTTGVDSSSSSCCWRTMTWSRVFWNTSIVYRPRRRKALRQASSYTSRARAPMPSRW